MPPLSREPESFPPSVARRWSYPFGGTDQKPIRFPECLGRCGPLNLRVSGAVAPSVGMDLRRPALPHHASYLKAMRRHRHDRARGLSQSVFDNSPLILVSFMPPCWHDYALPQYIQHKKRQDYLHLFEARWG